MMIIRVPFSKCLVLVLTSVALLFSSCLKEADFSGLVHSTDPVEERFKSSMEWNALHPFRNLVVGGEAYKLLITGDVHVGSSETINNYLKFIDRGEQEDISALVFVGDVSTGREKDQETFKDHLPDPVVKPSFVMAGNHELYFDGWKYFYRLFGSSTYYFTVKTPSAKDLYICLDSGSGTVGKSQLSWLKNLLESQRNLYHRCVIFTHSNFFREHHTASTSPLVEELLVLMDLFEKHKVNMVITAHDHKRAIDRLGNVTYIILDALRDDAKNATWLVLQREAGAEPKEGSHGYSLTFVKP
ncbi:MAG: metallophosphoesterase [Chitinophagaceae bacterium]|nr:metallophosphoesterase [Chitinophagaceae bacterium]